jgi:hypothetical protein
MVHPLFRVFIIVTCSIHLMPDILAP